MEGMRKETWYDGARNGGMDARVDGRGEGLTEKGSERETVEGR